MAVTTAPNPAKDFITFNVKTLDATKEFGDIVIINLTGEVVYSSQIKLNGSSMVDLTSLNVGTYVYKIMSDDTFISGRVVIID